MAPKEKTKRTLTPDQLEKLAVARAKANEVRQAMKEGREDAQVAALQAKMDVLKAKKKQKDITPTVPDNVNVEPPEMTSVPVPDEETDSNKEDKVAKPAPAVEPVPEPVPEPTQAGPPVEKLKKKKKKVIVMPNSDSDSDSDDSNVIFVKKTSRKKKEVPAQPPVPPPTPQLPAAPKVHIPQNPFFAYNMGLAQRNFQ